MVEPHDVFGIVACLSLIAWRCKHSHPPHNIQIEAGHWSVCDILHEHFLGCRPHQRRPHPPAAPTHPPCGPHCFKAPTSCTTLDAASRAASAAATNCRQEQEPAAAQSTDGLQSQHAASQAAAQADDGAHANEHEEEDDEELMRAAKGAAMRAAAACPAGLSGAGGQRPLPSSATGASPQYGPSGCEAIAHRGAVPIGPGGRAEHASNSPAGGVQPVAAMMSTRKRKHEQLLPPEGAFPAARPASAAASTLAAYGVPASSSAAKSDTTAPSPLQSPFLRSHARTHSSGDPPTLPSPAPSSLPIILSDSEDDKPGPTPTPHPRLLQIGASSNQPTPSPRQTPTPTPTPRSRKPPRSSSKGPSGAVGFSHGSADSPFVIVLSDSDDSNPPPKTEDAGEAPAAVVKSKANPKSLCQMIRQSTAKDSRGSGSDCKGCPSASMASPQAEPFDQEMKGSNAPSQEHSPVETLLASKQSSLDESTEHSPAVGHTSSQAVDAVQLQESVRQAARNSALLSVPRRLKSASSPSSHPPDPLDASPSDPSSDTITAGEPFLHMLRLVLGFHFPVFPPLLFSL